MSTVREIGVTEIRDRKDIMMPSHLFEPGNIGKMNTINRIVMPAMGTNYADENGYVTNKIKNYYEARSRGGAGLIIVEVTCVDAPVGKTIMRQLSIDDDKFIPGLSELAEVIKRHGARAAVQLHHVGLSATARITRIQPVGPSAIRDDYGDVPRELRVDEIKEIIVRFAAAARRARKAGFDGVEIHGAHRYLIAQFLSLTTNKRQDSYGGSLENRARLLLEVILAIRATVGQDYPVWCRLNGMEYGAKDGITIEEACQVAKWTEKAGVDAIHVSARPISSFRFPPMAEPPGNIVYLAEAVKKAVNIPVIAVGKITPEVGEKVLREGKADYVAIGKALIADPELPNKIRSGRLEDVVPCIGCLSCHDTLRNFGTEDGFVRCAINSMAGREEEYAIHPASRPKTIIVVGGGPAGMEAARVARLRGHTVKLYEKNQRLGGQLLLARVPPHKDGIDILINYLTKQITRLGVMVETGKEATAELIKELHPDVVILATGSTTLMPKIPGIKNYVSTAADILSGRVETGKRVVIIGGGLVGCETAEFLIEKGKQVTIVEMLDNIAMGVGLAAKRSILRMIAGKGIVTLTGSKCEKITGNGLIVTARDGKKLTLEADTIVMAAGAKPDGRLFEQIKGIAAEVHRAGDCVEPRRILDAIEDANRVSRLI